MKDDEKRPVAHIPKDRGSTGRAPAERRQAELTEYRIRNNMRSLTPEYDGLVTYSKENNLTVGSGSPETGEWYDLDRPGDGKKLYDQYGINGKPVYIVAITSNTDGSFNKITKHAFNEAYRKGFDVGLGIWIGNKTFHDASIYISDIDRDAAITYKNQHNQQAIIEVIPDGKYNTIY